VGKSADLAILSANPLAVRRELETIKDCVWVPGGGR
jgi:hypothetical protein